MPSTTPAYNLKVVLKETGLAADTLRAWERRYGLPVPGRSSGGHRMYSQRDIETIKWLMARQEDGLSISRAVDLWNELNASGADPLASSTPQMLPAIYPSPNTNLDSVRSQWIAACLNFSESKAEQALIQAFSMFPVEAVCMEVLQKGIAEIGRLWHEDRASVQQEHFASGLAMRRLDTLFSASPAPSRTHTVLVGCPPKEWHTFTPLLLSLLLRRRGLNVIYLGANIPTNRFKETATVVHANLVILAAQTLTSAATLHLTALSLTGLRIPVGFGGRIFKLQPDLVEHIPGYYLGDAIDSSLEEVEKFLKGKLKAFALKTASQEYLTAYQAFASKRTYIESTFKDLFQPLSISLEDLNTGIQFLGDNIAAALQLGDMEYVTEEMEWLKILLKSHKRPPQGLADFTNNYSYAVDKHMNAQSQPIKAWLNAQTTLEL